LWGCHLLLSFPRRREPMSTVERGDAPAVGRDYESR
jgi:hypothetical protein